MACMHTGSCWRNQFNRRTRIIGVLILLTTFSAALAKGQRPHPSEQTEFSAEDATVHKPAEIPQAVMTLLSKDAWVHDTLGDQNLPADKLPSTWFCASTIHLGSASEVDFVVVGEGPLAGGNVVTFWVFLATPNGYRLVLEQPAHDLTIKRTRNKGYRDIEASAESAVTFYSALFRFDGDVYKKRSGKTEPL
jgi:hypothetical protein